jgi:Peptidase family M48
MRKSFLLFLTLTLMVAGSVRAQNKPLPKICLTKGCVLQEMALAAASTAGSIQATREHRADLIQTRDTALKVWTPILSRFGKPDSRGYVAYSTIPQEITLTDATGKSTVLNLDEKLYGADRSIEIKPEDVDFVAGIIDRLRNGPYRTMPIHWTIVPTKTVNSSAIPFPPFVNVFSAMLDFTDRDPDMMAFVIAHEMGHTMDAQACSGSGMAHNAGLIFPGVEIRIIENQFFKFCENHADNIGLQLAGGAGYDPRAAIKLFGLLEEYQRQHGASGLNAFLGNHPLNSSRIANAEKVIGILTAGEK